MAPGQDDPTQAARESLKRAEDDSLRAAREALAKAEKLVCDFQVYPPAPRLLSNTICYLATLILMGWAVKYEHHLFAGVFLALSVVVLLRR